MSKVKTGGSGAVMRQVPVRALQIDDFCASYGIGRSNAYALIREGKLPDIVVAGRRLIPVDAAEKLIAAA
jgi:predicted DNA-binding transcriptional regulator AlpA